MIPDYAEKIDLPLERHCYGCSPTNPVGLQLGFYIADGQLYTTFTPGRHYCSWGSIMHGGIAATIIDEIAGWSVMFLRQSLCVTKNLNIDYHSPVTLHQPLTVISTIEQAGKREVRVAARLFNEQKQCCVAGTATLIPLSAPLAKRLNVMPPEDVDTFLAFIQQRFG